MDSSSIIITLILAFIVIAIIIFVILQNRYERKYTATKEHVVSTSKRYAYLLKLKDTIQPYKLNDAYTINRYMNSKAQLERINEFNQMINIIQGDQDLQNLLELCKKNINLNSIYEQDMQDIPNFMENSTVSKLYSKIEHKLSDDLTAEICPVIPVFKIHFEYTSPKGRNTWYWDTVFSSEEMLDFSQQCKIIERNKQSARYQRSIMTADLRYNVMKRDGFRCVLCGRDASDGVKLHVDHIVPIAKGGKTIKSNLRTLCEDCNIGKKDKYDHFGVN